MPDYEIIPLPPAEWRRYREIRLEALQNAPNAFMTTYASSIKRPPEAWQVRLAESERGEKSWMRFAQASGRLVGLAGAYAYDGGETAEIVQVYVSEGWRGRGIGRALIEAVLAVLVQKGFYMALLTVNPQQSAALALYKKLGFQVIDQIEGVREDGRRFAEYKMERELIKR